MVRAADDARQPQIHRVLFRLSKSSFISCNIRFSRPPCFRVSTFVLALQQPESLVRVLSPTRVLQSCNYSPSSMTKRRSRDQQGGSQKTKSQKKLASSDVAEPSSRATFLGLPEEVRWLIYDEAILPRLPGPQSALMYVHRRVLEEVRNWLPSQKLTLAINDKKSCRLGPRDEPILRRATNVELDLSELPGHISHPTINLLCSLWREECNLKKISFSVLDESQEKLPNSLPAAKKKLLCECILRPIELVWLPLSTRSSRLELF